MQSLTRSSSRATSSGSASLCLCFCAGRSLRQRPSPSSFLISPKRGQPSYHPFSTSAAAGSSTLHLETSSGIHTVYVGGSSASGSGAGTRAGDVPSALEVALSGQDPYKRIRYEQPLAMLGTHTHSSRLDIVRKHWPKALDIEPHLVPFWLITMLCDQSKVSRTRRDNTRDYNNPPEKMLTDIGLSIAAVGEDHWASGIFLPPTLRNVISLHQQLVSDDQNPFTISSSPNIYTDVRYDILSPFYPDGQRWDAVSAPKFTLPPPKLERGEMEKIVALQAEVFDTWEEVIVLSKPIRLYAMPSYRMAYKVTLPNGIGYFDAQVPNEYHRVMVDWPKGQTRTIQDSDLVNKLGDACGYFQRVNPETVHPNDEQIFEPTVGAYVLRPRTKTNTLISTIHNAMKRRGPMTADMWEDERILPVVAAEGVVQGHTLLEYADRRILSQPLGLEPTYPIKRNDTTSRSNLFAPRPGPSAGPAAPISSSSSSSSSSSASAKKAWKAKTTSTFSADSTASASASASASAPPRLETWAHKRADDTRQRAQGVVTRIAQSMRATRSAEAVQRALARYPNPLPDPKGFYQTLGIVSPPSFFLSTDPEKRAEMDGRVKDKFNQASLVAHPDRGGNSEHMIRMLTARDALATQPKRLTYYKTGRSANDKR